MFGRDWKLIRQKNNELYRRKTGEKKASVRFLKYIEYLQAKYKDNQGWRGNFLERINNILDHKLYVKATLSTNLLANIFFYLPWRPKRSHLEER